MPSPQDCDAEKDQLDAFIDDSDPALTRDQGGDQDDYLLQDGDLDDPVDLYVPGKCMNVLGWDDETDQEIVCGDACNPNEQLCHYCLTKGHRFTDMF